MRKHPRKNLLELPSNQTKSRGSLEKGYLCLKFLNASRKLSISDGIFYSITWGYLKYKKVITKLLLDFV